MTSFLVFSYLYFGVAFNACLAFGFQTILARQLSPNAYGDLVTVLAVITLVATLSSAGVPGFLLRIFGSEQRQNEKIGDFDDIKTLGYGSLSGVGLVRFNPTKFASDYKLALKKLRIITGLDDAVLDGKTGILVSPKNSVKLYENLWLLVDGQQRCKGLGQTAYERCR